MLSGKLIAWYASAKGIDPWTQTEGQRTDLWQGIDPCVFNMKWQIDCPVCNYQGNASLDTNCIDQETDPWPPKNWGGSLAGIDP